jgi:hypothetical protein
MSVISKQSKLFEKSEVITLFQSAVAESFLLYSKDLRGIGRDDDDNPCLPMNDEEIDGFIKIHSGRCGGRIGAEVKRAKRRLVFSELIKHKESGIDLTVVLVHKIAIKLLGRSFDKYSVINHFAQKGRTKKCHTSSEVIYVICNEITPMLDELSFDLMDIRLIAKNEWHNSPVRFDIMNDWNKQRGMMLEPNSDKKSFNELWLI